jgi:hypothetical protein
LAEALGGELGGLEVTNVSVFVAVELSGYIKERGKRRM